ncbi:type III-B CRISPR module-associated protein Cmr3 [Deinococcus murrayi]|uniref:type III-B CRISPR module-associated protein Cmr3 n=1 Tax=Deinococcus murrayi TaxID=68910 RepID=UPI000486233A|nr:type III-B CRISPR module-associated protein Cmr3 [Deinococcus murrayi]
MSDTILEITPLAPLLLRDGRPFAGGGEESRAHSLPLPLPHTLAGFVRTQMGEGRGLKWRDLSDDALHRELQALHNTPIRALPLRDETFMFPAPLNAVVEKPQAKKPEEADEVRIYRALPAELQEGEGTDAPDGLRPLLLTDRAGNAPGDAFKPQDGYRYWPQDAMQTWLLGGIPEKLERVEGPPTDERTHVAMNSETGTGDDGMLFTVSYRAFEERVKVKREPPQSETDGQEPERPRYRHCRWTLRVKTDLTGDFAPLGHLGGERRPAALRDCGNRGQWPNLGTFEGLEAALLSQDNPRLCFVLTSPALFAGGWKPGWLSLTPGQARAHDGAGLPAGVRELMAGGARLVGAAVGRRVPVSGWNLRENRPKAVRWAVPAGSVYFLEVPGAFDREKLLGAWLKPLSDDQDDQRDGFGCALWGVW